MAAQVNKRSQPPADECSTVQQCPVSVAAFYQFADFTRYAGLQQPLLEFCQQRDVMGTILLAAEGINGTIAGSADALGEVIAYLRSQPGLQQLDYKSAQASRQPFHRMKVRLKKEIVSLGVPGVSPLEAVGEYVAPEFWNALISRDDVRVIDTRNDYEVHLGSFAGAEDPGTRSFRDFPAWVEQNLDPQRDQHVAMFCTGGIRCEKSTAYLKKLGFKNVYHLQGGILNYLEKTAPEASLWQGDCFVFDNRVTVDHQLREGDLELCPACRMPLSEADRQSPKFELHVSCPQCFERLTPERREGLLERARQMQLAEERGEKHLGRR
jgi:UPF0176 protein